MYVRQATKSHSVSKHPKTVLDINEIKNYDKRIEDLEKLVYYLGIGGGDELRLDSEETPKHDNYSPTG